MATNRKHAEKTVYVATVSRRDNTRDFPPMTAVVRRYFAQMAHLKKWVSTYYPLATINGSSREPDGAHITTHDESWPIEKVPANEPDGWVMV